MGTGAVGLEGNTGGNSRLSGRSLDVDLMALRVALSRLGGSGAFLGGRAGNLEGSYAGARMWYN